MGIAKKVACGLNNETLRILNLKQMDRFGSKLVSYIVGPKRRYDTEHNVIQHNDTQHNNIQHNSK